MTPHRTTYARVIGLEVGAIPSGRAVVNGAASVSALRASVPIAGGLMCARWATPIIDIPHGRQSGGKRPARLARHDGPRNALRNWLIGNDADLHPSDAFPPASLRNVERWKPPAPSSSVREVPLNSWRRPVLRLNKQTPSCSPKVSPLSVRLIAAANGDKSWKGNLMREAAQAIEARRVETGTGSVHESAVRQDAPDA